MFPYGNKTCSPKNKEAAGFELSCGHDPPRPDPKDYRRGRKRKHRTPYRGNPGSPRRRRAAPRLSRPSRLASTLDRLQAIRTQSACLINAPSEVKESAFRTSFTERVKIDCSEWGLDGL